MINIIKSQPAPLCLSVEKKKASGDYKCGEVLKRLNEDFNNKCYLCEEKEPSTINVEHFIPHKGDIDLKFEWNNLFLACSHCNNIKLAKYDNIINCTDTNLKVTDLLQFIINPFPKEKVQIKSLSSDIKTEQTAKLLDEIYNGTTELKTIEGQNIRDKLSREILDFTKLLHEYFYEYGLNNEDKEELKKQIRRKLSPKTAFTAFKIWIIKNNEVLLKEFNDLII